MHTTSNWQSRREVIRIAAIALGVSLSVTAYRVPAAQTDPPACLASTPAGEDWTAEASRRAIAFDTLLSEVLAREGPWLSCHGEQHGKVDRGAGFGRLTFSFPSGVTLTIESAPPESSVVALRRLDGLVPKAEWIGLFKRYASARGIPVDWSRARSDTGEDGAALWRYEAVEPGWNASAVIECNPSGRLVGMALSVAL